MCGRTSHMCCRVAQSGTAFNNVRGGIDDMVHAYLLTHMHMPNIIINTTTLHISLLDNVHMHMPFVLTAVRVTLMRHIT